MTDMRPEDDEAPLDPAAERVRRKLVRFMAINLGILFSAVMAVVVALVYRGLSSPGPEATPVATEIPSPPPGTILSGDIALPAGSRLIGHTLSGNRLSLDIAIGSERRIVIYDMAEGRIIGTFTLAPAN